MIANHYVLTSILRSVVIPTISIVTIMVKKILIVRDDNGTSLHLMDHHFTVS
jgi:hypothetical protein